MPYLKLTTTRDAYGAQAVIKEYRTLTVGELKRYLEGFDENLPIVLSFDRGYTYGHIDEDSFCEEEDENE